MGELCQGISGAGGDDENVEQLLRPHRLHLGKGVQRRRAADGFRHDDMLPRRPEAAVNAVGGVGKNGGHVMLPAELLHNGEHNRISTKRAAHGKSDFHNHSSLHKRT